MLTHKYKVPRAMNHKCNIHRFCWFIFQKPTKQTENLSGKQGKITAA